MECVSIESGKKQEDRNTIMNETSKLTGRNIFLNMPQSYDFRDKTLLKKQGIQTLDKNEDLKSKQIQQCRS